MLREPSDYFIQRQPTPLELCAAYRYPDTVPMVLPLVKRKGMMVLLLSYRNGYSVIPTALYDDQEDATNRFPTDGLTKSSRADLPFPYEISTTRPLLMASAPRDLAERWVRVYVDIPLPQRH